MKTIRLLFFTVVILSVSFSGCKVFNKSTDAKNTEADYRPVKVKLANLLSDETLTIEQLQKELNSVINLNIDNEEVQDLIVQVKDKITAKKLELAERDLENANREAQMLKKEILTEESNRTQEAEAENKYEILKPEVEQIFTDISKFSDRNSNREIAKMLEYCQSGEIPVLTIISQVGGEKEYDKPTTIKRYLEYLRDQKRYEKTIESISFDENGKIIEIELRK